jgi:hypothetical protein
MGRIGLCPGGFLSKPFLALSLGTSHVSQHSSCAPYNTDNSPTLFFAPFVVCLYAHGTPEVSVMSDVQRGIYKNSGFSFFFFPSVLVKGKKIFIKENNPKSQ